MKKKFLKKLTSRLEGINYAFFSGTALEVYTKGRRQSQDVDVLVSESDIHKIGERFNVEPEKRLVKKEKFTIDDYGFVTDFRGIEVEATTGFPPIRLKEGTIERVFNNKRKKEYLGQIVYVVHLEEVIAHKAKMGRDKDLADLRMIKDLDIEIDKKLLMQIAEDMDIGEGLKILKRLKLDQGR